MRDVSHAPNDSLTWEDALHRVLERLCDAEHWQLGVPSHPPQNDTADVITLAIGCVHDAELQPFMRPRPRNTSHGVMRACLAVYADGEPVWVDDRHTLRTLMPKRATALEQTSLRSCSAADHAGTRCDRRAGALVDRVSPGERTAHDPDAGRQSADRPRPRVGTLDGADGGSRVARAAGPVAHPARLARADAHRSRHVELGTEPATGGHEPGSGRRPRNKSRSRRRSRSSRCGSWHAGSRSMWTRSTCMPALRAARLDDRVPSQDPRPCGGAPGRSSATIAWPRNSTGSPRKP